jgi:dTMP kinase
LEFRLQPDLSAEKLNSDSKINIENALGLEGRGVGLLVAIEGIDGSGKGTQAARLCESLRSAGTRCELLSFPRYRETQFGAKIADFLNGRFGKLNEVSPFLVSLLFAGDRFESRQILLQAIAENDIVLCDRYVASNIAHQAAKVEGDERQEMIRWVRYVEHELYGLPPADRTLFLDVPVQQATALIALKARRSYTDRSADLQEADSIYLQKVHDVYARLAAEEPGWVRIDCVGGGTIKPVDQIAGEIRQALGR